MSQILTLFKQCCFIFGLFFTSAFVSADNVSLLRENSRPLTVYKSPSCGCCGAWIDHMKEADFSARVEHPDNLDAVKRQLGVSPQYQACHTSVKSGYFFEGHIPAEVVSQFLRESPENISGLAVPGMPMGSPGMDVSGHYRPYDVLKINKDGSSVPYARVSKDRIDYLEQAK